jgi:membrane-associated PAP2 superfamily phosphatase
MKCEQAGSAAAMADGLPIAPAAWRRNGGFALLASAVVLMVLAQATDLDLAIADLSFDTALHQFAWRNSWFADVFMHRWMKLPLVVLGSVLVLAAIAEAVFRWPRIGAADRWRLRASAAMALLAPLVIGLVKHQSASHCPWSIERYGGPALYVRLLDALPAGFEAGGCLPAGHASSALWLAGLCVWWLPHRPRIAAAVFAAGLAAGFALGWVQQLRGAHFLSHTLWSMWITAALTWTLLSGLAGLAWLQHARLQRQPHPPANAGLA